MGDEGDRMSTSIDEGRGGPGLDDKKAEDENRRRTHYRMRTSKDNYGFKDSMRTRKGWVPGQLAGPRTKERQGQ